jgi:hypothetical protein
VTAGYRVEWRWLLMGPLLGYYSGLVAVSLLVGVPLLATAPILAPLVALPAGALLGGPVGAGVGLVAGVPLAFLVGPHLPLATASRRAYVLGALLPPLVLLLAVTLWPVRQWFDESLGPALDWLGPFPYLAATVLGGVTAARTARIDMPRSPVS